MSNEKRIQQLIKARREIGKRCKSVSTAFNAYTRQINRTRQLLAKQERLQNHE